MIRTRMQLAGVTSDAAQLYTLLDARLGEHALSVPYLLKASADPGLLAGLLAHARIGDELDVTLDDNEPGKLPRLRLIAIDRPACGAQTAP